MVDVYIERARSETSLCREILLELIRIEDALLSYLKSSQGETVSTAMLRAEVVRTLDDFGWHTNAFVTSKLPVGTPQAGLRVNGLRDISDCGCKMRHRVIMNCLLDNRQAIGTNLLKFELASKSYSSDHRDCTSVGLCISEDTKSRRQWDTSVGTYSDYVAMLNTPYSGIIESRIHLWELNF